MRKECNIQGGLVGHLYGSQKLSWSLKQETAPCSQRKVHHLAEEIQNQALWAGRISLSGFLVAAGSVFLLDCFVHDMPGLLLPQLIKIQNTEEGELDQERLIKGNSLSSHFCPYLGKTGGKYSLFEMLENHEHCYAGTDQDTHDVKHPGHAVIDVIPCPALQFPATVIKILSTAIFQALSVSDKRGQQRWNCKQKPTP